MAATGLGRLGRRATTQGGAGTAQRRACMPRLPVARQGSTVVLDAASTVPPAQAAPSSPVVTDAAAAAAATVVPAASSRPASSLPIQPKLAAAAAGMAGLMALAPALHQALQSAALPPLQDVFAAAAAAAGSAAVALRVRYGDHVHLEFHKGQLYLQLGVPSSGPRVSPGAIVTRPTGDARGNGAYAATTIPKGTWLGDYSGDRLTTAAFDARYPDGVGDYAMAVNSDTIIDAAHLAPATASFHPVHMNHSRTRCNVVRYYQRGAGRVAFFTCADVAPGEELLYDYGRAYWRGREHLELP